MDEAAVNKTIPRDLGRVLDVEPQVGYKAKAFTKAFLQNSTEHHARLDTQSVLDRKALILKYARPKKCKLKNRRAKGLNAQQKRKMKIFNVKTEHQRYELFLPLHDLWKQYIIDLCGRLNQTSSPQAVQQKLLKADLHGAIMTVVRSKCPSYVGTTGILIQEFKHVFKFITQQDKMKVIPKRNSVFQVEINGFISHIYGSKFEHRASERSAKKFKVSGSIDL
ncbi:ribonuclease P protein subunit p29-like isoform X2 [Entelurus aequoreus]|uniref:ribonuclease P protein subunit p29-like isoform X2 n=1 Tax=Entelurus aequoreus TaxID=161455 RepID=UPI002B1CECD6|nr:ribonuclease P protein subunit p29-like isoform X2 [Entelurus aequoreus]XP_061889864.1 ribonuclease P protein subunit p29-like isoform X2 [Entelurus aequoreus]